MSSKLFIVILLLSPVLTFAQYNFKPIIDTSAICSSSTEIYKDKMPNPYYNYDKKKKVIVFYIVEKMPSPELSLDKIENILKRNIRFSEAEKKLNGDLYFQCVVNCKGNAGDFQVMHCPDGFSGICNKVLTLFREQLTSWHPGKQLNVNVNILIKTEVKIRKGNFEVITPLY